MKNIILVSSAALMLFTGYAKADSPCGLNSDGSYSYVLRGVTSMSYIARIDCEAAFNNDPSFNTSSIGTSTDSNANNSNNVPSGQQSPSLISQVFDQAKQAVQKFTGGSSGTNNASGVSAETNVQAAQQTPQIYPTAVAQPPVPNSVTTVAGFPINTAPTQAAPQTTYPTAVALPAIPDPNSVGATSNPNAGVNVPGVNGPWAAPAVDSMTPAGAPSSITSTSPTTTDMMQKVDASGSTSNQNSATATSATTYPPAVAISNGNGNATQTSATVVPTTTGNITSQPDPSSISIATAGQNIQSVTGLNAAGLNTTIPYALTNAGGPGATVDNTGIGLTANQVSANMAAGIITSQPDLNNGSGIGAIAKGAFASPTYDAAGNLITATPPLALGVGGATTTLSQQNSAATQTANQSEQQNQASSTTLTTTTDGKGNTVTQIVTTKGNVANTTGSSTGNSTLDAYDPIHAGVTDPIVLDQNAVDSANKTLAAAQAKDKAAGLTTDNPSAATIAAQSQAQAAQNKLAADNTTIAAGQTLDNSLSASAQNVQTAQQTAKASQAVADQSALDLKGDKTDIANAQTKADAAQALADADPTNTDKAAAAKAAQDELTQDQKYLADDKQAIKDAKSDAKKLQAAIAKDAKDTKAKTGDTQMQDVGDSKQRGCGQYGGANCLVSQVVNAGAKMGDSLGSAMGSMAVNNSSAQAQQALAAKGATATASDFNTAQVTAAQAAEKAEKGVLIVDSVAGALQLERLMEHTFSQGTVRAMQSKEVGNIQKSLSDTTTDTIDDKRDISLKNREAYARQVSVMQANKCRQLTDTPTSNALTQCKQNIDREVGLTVKGSSTGSVNDNAASEIAFQQAASVTQMAAMIDTAKNIATHAANMKADGIIAGTTVPTGGGFLFNPSAPGSNPNDVAPAATPDTGAVVANTDNSAAPTNPGDAQFNPGGDPNGGNGAPPAGDMIPGTLAGNQNPSTAGNGGVGGTTAAKDDTVASTGKKAADAVGTYTATDNSGSTFARSGGSAASPVGMDSSWADLLKKMLPGGEDDKKAADPAALAFTDRSLASDQAAVIGRNKNIFEEIHKRYQKKNSEGAVVF